MLFIINPIAGGDRAKNIHPLIEEIMENTNITYKIVYTKGHNDATRIAYDAIKKGYKTIVAVGGDGTINEVAKGIIKAGKGTLGIIPGGTGNDLVRSLNIPIDPKEALQVILTGKTKKIDVGEANGKVFLNVASVGFDSEIAKNTEKIKKHIKNKFAYTVGLLKTLITYKNKKVEIILDNNVKINTNLLLLAVANG
ncbi:diacylglycerol/lipid kinase family protein [Caldisalinibacter kiritimatiensis]|uniref:Transcription regulator n=1 Tax=Caldisalinibacter kiritimatiensis TaxID=1304284 RepID=R1ARL3_9FIRM|nr:YegS/Rv2252/BmrU family lipid kinase [Caldisalinibacter kiritimatiensis]EOC99787.1 Transcription regulator [Caldisalinibacter kiritimatiensis]